MRIAENIAEIKKNVEEARKKVPIPISQLPWWQSQNQNARTDS